MEDDGLARLEPMASLSMADQVEARLHDYIIKKAIRPGDPIPKEQELALALGVSRNVVREGLEYESKLEHTSVGRVTHADLVKILYGNDPDAFPNAMRAHLQPHFDYL